MAGTGTQERLDPAQFSRARSSDAPTLELRGDAPREVVDVLDAVSMARGQTRTSLVNEILRDWTDKVLHEHSLVQRVRSFNPAPPESAGEPK